MYFKKVKKDVCELHEYYEQFLRNKYSWNDLMNYPILVKFLKSDNMKCILSFDDKNNVSGGICYTKMLKCDMVYIHYVAAASETILLQLLTVMLLEELTSKCIISSYEIQNTLKFVGFNYINLECIKPSLSFDKESKTCSFAVYGTTCIPKNTLIDFMYEYYRRIAFVPYPEKNESFLCNMEKISRLEELIPCVA